MALHRRTVVSKPGGVSQVPAADHLSSDYADLWDFLSSATWPGSSPPEPRQTGTITLFTEDGWVKAFINDRAQRQQHCVAGVTLSAVLEAANEAVASDETPWRPAPAKATGRGRA